MTVKTKESLHKNLVIGVFINRKHAHDLITMNPDFVSSHRYIRYIELAKANEYEDVTLCFFTSEDVNFEMNYVTGIYYSHQENSWRKKIFPLPHLLYDRGGGIGKKSTHVINKFKDLGITNINAQHFFDKWDLYDRLAKLNRILPHLPVTVKGDKALKIFQMLDQYGHVYVKTRRGSCGLGVIRLEKMSHYKYRYFYSRGGELSSEIFTAQEIKKIINRHFNRNPFIIQKPIDLMKKGQCIIDFRSEVQKNGEGQLVIAGTTARIGRPRSPIASNTRTEDYYPLEEFMKTVMKLDAPEASRLQAKINHFLKNVFLAVEQVYGSFGEMGIDFGLDTHGHLWLIECNSKSARVALYRAFGRQKVRESFCNLLQYAKYLAEERNNSNE